MSTPSGRTEVQTGTLVQRPPTQTRTQRCPTQTPKPKYPGKGPGLPEGFSKTFSGGCPGILIQGITGEYKGMRWNTKEYKAREIKGNQRKPRNTREIEENQDKQKNTTKQPKKTKKSRKTEKTKETRKTQKTEISKTGKLKRHRKSTTTTGKPKKTKTWKNKQTENDQGNPLRKPHPPQTQCHRQQCWCQRRRWVGSGGSAASLAGRVSSVQLGSIPTATGGQPNTESKAQKANPKQNIKGLGTTHVLIQTGHPDTFGSEHQQNKRTNKHTNKPTSVIKHPDTTQTQP